MSANSELPRNARVVVIGGGVIGCSIAYHLTKIGWSDVVLVERQQLTSGTTWHAAGLIGQLRASMNMTKLARYTKDLYSRLESETGQATGYRQSGSYSIATQAGRLEEMKRNASMAKVFGLQVDIVTTAEIKERVPLLNTDDVLGGIYIATDGYGNAVDITQALSKAHAPAARKVFRTRRSPRSSTTVNELPVSVPTAATSLLITSCSVLECGRATSHPASA